MRRGAESRLVPEDIKKLDEARRKRDEASTTQRTDRWPWLGYLSVRGAAMGEWTRIAV